MHTLEDGNSYYHPTILPRYNNNLLVFLDFDLKIAPNFDLNDDVPCKHDLLDDFLIIFLEITTSIVNHLAPDTLEHGRLGFGAACSYLGHGFLGHLFFGLAFLVPALMSVVLVCSKKTLLSA